MFKTGKVVLIVDSVEKAIKFYTEKLLFSIVGLECDDEGGVHLSRAEVKKGKFNIIFRLPSIDELAEFSMVRRCTGRAAAVVAIAKKGIDRYYKGCKKKGLEVFIKTENKNGSVISFGLKDPFGLRLLFTEIDEEIVGTTAFNRNSFCGMDMQGQTISKKDKNSEASEKMVKWLRGFGISRRVAKKYIKLWIDRVKS